MYISASDTLVSSLISKGSSKSNDFEYSQILYGDITIPKEVLSLIPQGYSGCLNSGYYLGVDCASPYTITEVEYDI